MKYEDCATIDDFLEFSMKDYLPDEVVIQCDGQTMSRRQLSEACDAYMRRLAHFGVTAGCAVGYTMPNCTEIIPLVIALCRMGACMIPVFHLVPDMGKAAVFANGRAMLVVTVSQMADKLRSALKQYGASIQVVTIDEDIILDVADRETPGAIPVSSDYDPSAPLLVASSSGTTGMPKPVVWNRSNGAALLRASGAMVRPMAENSPERTSTLAAFPLASPGIVNVLGTIFAGVRIIVTSDVSPVSFIKLMAATRPDSVSAPPAWYEALLSMSMIRSVDTTSVRNVFTGMDFMAPSLMVRLQERFSNLEGFVSGYGLVETSNVFMISVVDLSDAHAVVTNRFRLVEGIGNRIEIRDENGTPLGVGESGELFVSGPSVVGGYLGNPGETALSFQNGWFRTGDTARNEGGGAVTLLGRKKYLIKRGGKSVSPIVVQGHIDGFPGVNESAVVGVPHPLYGEMIWAFVSVRSGAVVELSRLMKHCRESLVNYMVPDQVRFVDAIPRKSGIGKVDFDAMIRMAIDELSSMNGGADEQD